MITLAIRIVNQLALGFCTKLPNKSPYTLGFRAWPIDIDTYFHINNAAYVRIAEVCRWRGFPQANLFNLALKKGVLFLAVDQTVEYKKSIQMFQKYAVSTTVSVTENKWIWYQHTFHTHPDEVKADQKPTTFCVVTCKAVLKEKNGKTIPPLEIMNGSDFYKALIEDQDTEIHKHIRKLQEKHEKHQHTETK